MDGWPEYWLNTGTSACLRNIHAVMTKRIQLAKRKGFDAIDPVRCQLVAGLSEQDNIDASENTTGWPISSKQSIAYLKWLAKTAHDHGLGCGLKNGGAYLQRDSLLVSRFDFVRRWHRRQADRPERHRAVRGVQRVQCATARRREAELAGLCRLPVRWQAGACSVLVRVLARRHVETTRSALRRR